MFSGDQINPSLDQSLTKCGLNITWDSPVISADLVVFHNPSCLKFNAHLDSRIVCQSLIVVTHENFVLPSGDPSFDVAHCLEAIEEATLCRRRALAPVSAYNRDTVETWLASETSDWELAPRNWFNICDFEFAAPNKQPSDRRGRHSRPGFEKFPPLDVMHTLFPAHAQNVILGADTFLNDQAPKHWTLFPFREITVDKFLDQIDFFVYFTNDRWRESFGRVIAEAVAAGKLVLTDVQTAKNLGNGVVGTTPQEVDGLIADFITNPQTYAATVKAAQKSLKAYSGKNFTKSVTAFLAETAKSKSLAQ